MNCRSPPPEFARLAAAARLRGAFRRRTIAAAHAVHGQGQIHADEQSASD